MGTTAKPARSKRELDALLDEALRETFPASDPIAVGQPTATEPRSHPAGRKSAVRDDADERRPPQT